MRTKSLLFFVVVATIVMSGQARAAVVVYDEAVKGDLAAFGFTDIGALEIGINTVSGVMGFAGFVGDFDSLSVQFWRANNWTRCRSYLKMPPVELLLVLGGW